MMTAVENKIHVENNELTIWLEKRGVKDSGKVALVFEGVLKLLAATALAVAAYFTIKCAFTSYYASYLTNGTNALIRLAGVEVGAMSTLWVLVIGAVYISGIRDVVAAINHKEPQVPKDKLTNDNL